MQAYVAPIALPINLLSIFISFFRIMAVAYMIMLFINMFSKNIKSKYVIIIPINNKWVSWF